MSKAGAPQGHDEAELCEVCDHLVFTGGKAPHCQEISRSHDGPHSWSSGFISKSSADCHIRHMEAQTEMNFQKTKLIPQRRRPPTLLRPMHV